MMESVLHTTHFVQSSSYNHTFLVWYVRSLFKSRGGFCYLGLKCSAGSATNGRQMSTTWETASTLREKFLL